MNEWGPDGCREHVDDIIDKMLEEAKRRNWRTGSLPVVPRIVCRSMIELACRLAEREAASRED